MQSSSTLGRPAATTLYASILQMDPEELGEFRRRLRRRYSREDILAQLQSCAERLGTSPTMREFAADPHVTIHPQTVVDHFGSWNDAKREAGLVPRRLATREELIGSLRELAAALGRRPTAVDIDEARGRVPGRGVFVKEFGSIAAALAAAGYAVPSRDEQLEASIDLGARYLVSSGRLPSFRDWERVRARYGGDTLTAWQLYRSFDHAGGAWSAFQYAVCQRARLMQDRAQRGGATAELVAAA